ncbi:EF-hand domain and EF-hand domain pair-containing protein [Aphelenchoides bicaudatus]|nr:EF-hand domain and EF-hand domain pair-containing protein [Aphelenchoides bicaudatus]
MSISLAILLAVCVAGVDAMRENPNVADITPIPMEFLNPRLTEFRRIDTNNDNALTFGEFLLSDRSFVESQSRYFHDLDQNGDGRVTRDEFEQFFKHRDDEHHRQRVQTDQFFKQLSLTPFDAVTINRHLFGFGPSTSPNGQQIIIKSVSNGPPGQQQPVSNQQQQQ